MKKVQGKRGVTSTLRSGNITLWKKFIKVPCLSKHLNFTVEMLFHISHVAEAKSVCPVRMYIY